LKATIVILKEEEINNGLSTKLDDQ